MIERDYLMRIVHQLSQALTQVLFRKRAEEYDEALLELQRTGQLFLDLDPGVLHTVTYEDLYNALTERDLARVEAASLVAELFRQQGEIFARQGLPDAAAHSAHLALRLYLHLFVTHDELRTPDYVARIDGLLEEVDPYALPRDAQHALFQYYDALGRFAKAEDILFILACVPEAALYEEGLAFYNRLRSTSYKRLQQGGLSFPEIVEGLEAFHRQMSTT